MNIRTIVVGQLAANCYVVTDELTKTAVVIDPGDNPEEIEAALRDAEVELSYILLTHGHPDHSFAAGELQQHYGVPVLMHEADVPQLEGHQDLVVMFYDINRYIKPRLGEFLREGDIVSLGSVELKVIHTPGHTPGGLCFAQGGHVFTGDTLFAGDMGRTDLPGGSYDDLMRSIREKLLVLPEKTIIYPGHGPISSIGAERVDNPLLTD
jgi:glyoxylase-like metal-dependent hydrolase (beta-lactamase superfamily II)